MIVLGKDIPFLEVAEFYELPAHLVIRVNFFIRRNMTPFCHLAMERFSNSAKIRNA